MIRPAGREDLPKLVELGAALHAESPRHSRLQFSARKVQAQIGELIASPLGLVIVADDGGDLVGVALAMMAEEWYSEDRIGQEISVYVIPARRGSTAAARLIAAMDAWASTMGAKRLQAGATTGVRDDRTVELYERLGFKRAAIGVERVYY